MKTGDWLDSRYRIIRALGEGGQGSVYLAIQERIYKFYAIKVMKKDGAGFSWESVELWKRLSHPGLPEIVDILETEEEICLVMEYIEGETLEDLLDKGEIPGEHRVLPWCIQVCEILEYLHGQNPPIVFGDIKLSNLILQKNRIVMVDLGSAVLRSSRGKLSGTREYLPPEAQQWEAEPKRDIYALGKCMEQLLAGNRSISSEMKKIQKRCVSLDTKVHYPAIKNCRMDLEKLQSRPWMLSIMIVLAFCIMALAGDVMEKERLAVDASAQYERLLEEAADCSMRDQRTIFMEAIEVDPSCETGYLNLLENYLEDSCFSMEEEQCFREILAKSQGDGVCFAQRLGENETGYAKVAWELAMAYWYFYEEEGGRNYASKWFVKLLELPQETLSDEGKRKQSQIYAEIGSYRLALEHSDRTGEMEVDFRVYWQDLMELLSLTTKEDNTGSMTQLCFWQELLIQMVHYRLEFMQAGIQKSEMKEVWEEIKGEIQNVKDSNKVILEKKEEIQKLLENGWEELP